MVAVVDIGMYPVWHLTYTAHLPSISYYLTLIKVVNMSAPDILVGFKLLGNIDYILLIYISYTVFEIGISNAIK